MGKTVFNVISSALCASSVAIIAFGNGGVIAAAFVVVLCSCTASLVFQPYLEKRACNCTKPLTGGVPPKCWECLNAAGTDIISKVALYATPILIAILFVVAVTVGRRR
jgi:hypothetical protein